MRSIVIYASRYGNTRRLAEAIAEALHTRGDVQLLPADEVSSLQTDKIDLLVIGGPTEVHGMTPPIARIFKGLRRHALAGVATATFDTRIRGARWMTGSAASGMSRKLRHLGARLIAQEESFFVAGRNSPATGETPQLEPGEEERAMQWAASLAEMVAQDWRSAPASAQER